MMGSDDEDNVVVAIDDKNNFLSREEAFEYAIKCGQISDTREPGDACERLVSEDLW